MDTVAQKRRISRKKLSTISFPEDVVCQYSRFSNLLSHAASRKWLLYEWQYDEIEDAFFHKCRTFEMILNAKFPQLKTRDLTRAEWRVIRQIAQPKCRRFSSKFITEQRTELEKYRCRYRILRENNRHDQLMELNAFHDGANGLISTLDSQQSQRHQLFRLFIDVKKMFAKKRALVMKLREINNNRAEMQPFMQQQQQQHALANGDLNIEPIKTANTTAIRVVAKIRDCNNEIMSNLNQMTCFQIVKDALVFSAMRRKNIALAFSPPYFRRTSLVQVYESQQQYRSETFITATDSQTLLNTLLTQVLITLQYEIMLKISESVDCFADGLVKEQMAVVNEIVPSDSMSYFETVCVPKFFDILNTVNELML